MLPEKEDRNVRVKRPSTIYISLQLIVFYMSKANVN